MSLESQGRLGTKGFEHIDMGENSSTLLFQPDHFYTDAIAEPFLQKYFAPHRVPAGVGIREEMPDIGLPDGSQNRIANGVHQDIRIGMAVQALRVRYLDTAEEELATLDQPMDVIAYTDMVHGG